MKKIGVYLIKNSISHRARIGSAKDINKRFSNHKAKLRNGTANALMQQDFNQWGEASFDFIILEECLVSELFEKEAYYMELYSDVASYNVNKVKSTKKKIRRGKEAKNYKEKRSKITSGINNGHNTKLSEEDVLLIRELIAKGLRQIDIAQKFNVSSTLVCKIRTGKRWASVV